ncbi:MAG TPA: nucleotidyltransferase family protein, partial [Anaerolineae bacterium]
GTRLRPMTLDRPKPMMPINDKPLLEYTVGWLHAHGIQDIAINLHYHPEAIVNHFGDGSALGVLITYSHEDPILGTAGAVRKLNGFLQGGPLVVVYGDVLTNLDLRALLAFHHQAVVRNPATGATLGLQRLPNPVGKGVVELDDTGRVIRFVEKPQAAFSDLVNAGILIIEPGIVEYIPPDTFYDFGQHLFPRLLEMGVALYGWIIPNKTYLLDIGTPEAYAQAQREWPGVSQRC